jgi:hypothetical protein
MTEIKYVTIWYCWSCNQRGVETLHDGKGEYVDQVSDCPECGAPHYHQYPHFVDIDYEHTGNTPIDHPEAIKMFKQAVRRGIKKTIKNMPIEALKVGFEQYLGEALISLIDNPDKVEEYIDFFNFMDEKLKRYQDAIPACVSDKSSKVIPDNIPINIDEPIY